MNRTITTVLLTGAFSALPLWAVPPPVGSISENVGYSEATGFNGSNYQTLTQRHVADHPETVLAIVFATPW